MKWVKSYNPDGTSTYFPSLEECCKVFGIKHHETLTRYIEQAQLHEDGKTFFDYPTKQEIEEIRAKFRGQAVKCFTEERVAVRRDDEDDC